MDIHVGDVLKMKKAHPCGSQEWLVLRAWIFGCAVWAADTR